MVRQRQQVTKSNKSPLPLTDPTPRSASGRGHAVYATRCSCSDQRVVHRCRRSMW